jgi:hypothetical protein
MDSERRGKHRALELSNASTSWTPGAPVHARSAAAAAATASPRRRHHRLHGAAKSPAGGDRRGKLILLSTAAPSEPPWDRSAPPVAAAHRRWPCPRPPESETEARPLRRACNRGRGILRQERAGCLDDLGGGGEIAGGGGGGQ